MVELEESLFVKVVFVGCSGAQDHAHAGLEFLLGNVGLKAMQVKGISNKVFVELNHELVTFKRAKPLDPAHEGGAPLVAKLAFTFIIFFVTFRVVVLLLLLSHHHKLLLLLQRGLIVQVHSFGLHLN